MKQYVAVVAAAILALISSSARGDCGSISIRSAILGAPIALAEKSLESGKRERQNVEFDPLKATVFEPRQRAIILWDGSTETLLLSTDQRTEQPTQILEVIPFPSQPEVALGDFATFERAQRLVVTKQTWAVAHGGAQAGAAALPESAGRIAFAERIGAHDLAVAQALDAEKFGEFVRGYLKEKYGVNDAAIRPDFLAIIGEYARDGYTWFAFDSISLSDKVQSRQPIQYRFKSDRLFYPLRISALEGGKTAVDLLVVTREPLTTFEGVSTGRIKRGGVVTITRGELGSVNGPCGRCAGHGQGLAQHAAVVADRRDVELQAGRAGEIDATGTRDRIGATRWMMFWSDGRRRRSRTPARSDGGCGSGRLASSFRSSRG